MLEWLKNQSKCRWWCVLVKLSQLFLERKSQQRGTRAVFKVDHDRVEMTPEGEKAKFHKLVIHHRSRVWFYSVVSALSSACSLCGAPPPNLFDTEVVCLEGLKMERRQWQLIDVKRLCLSWTDALWLLDWLLIGRDDSNIFTPSTHTHTKNPCIYVD